MRSVSMNLLMALCEDLGKLTNCYVGVIPDWQQSEGDLYHIISGIDPITGRSFPGYSILTSSASSVDTLVVYLNRVIKLSKLRIEAASEI